MNLPPFSTLLPTLPWQTLEVVITVIAALGSILITYGIFLKIEKKQDVILSIGAFCLLIYALYIGNLLFTIAMTGLFLSSLIEFIEIVLGLHKDWNKK